jgi:hypothetical protein
MLLAGNAAGAPTLYNAVKRFCNNLHLNRATLRLNMHTAFATLQGEAQDEPPADTQSIQPTDSK